MTDNPEESGVHLSKSLRDSLAALHKRRIAFWSSYLESMYENDDDDSVTAYLVNEIPDNYKHNQKSDYFKGFSSKVSRAKLTESEKEIVCKIEDKLQSNVKQLLLRREKSKTFRDSDDYYFIHPMYHKEVERLMAHITLEDFITYGRLCCTADPNKMVFIQKKFPKMRELLSSRDTAMCSIYTSKIWQKDFAAEWNKIAKHMLDEDIVVYAVKVRRVIEGKDPKLVF